VLFTELQVNNYFGKGNLICLNFASTINIWSTVVH
jgi:hypothetical protein